MTILIIVLLTLLAIIATIAIFIWRKLQKPIFGDDGEEYADLVDD